MRTLVRAGAVVLWACLVGTAAGTQGLAGIAGAAQPNLASVQTHPSDAQCYIVAGELYCPCSTSNQSCCACTPGGVSTRRNALTGAAPYCRWMRRTTLL
jgi:hypothetical protein